jgi:hypothetical protein
MRKLILIASLLLASAAAHATEAPCLPGASNDAAPKAEQKVEQKADARPAEAAAPAKPSRRHASAKPHEDGEQKARRIAARYGVYW